MMIAFPSRSERLLAVLVCMSLSSGSAAYDSTSEIDGVVDDKASLALTEPKSMLDRAPAPASVVTDEPVGFYDRLADGSERPIRNDLVGTFAAMVQFVQSHSIDPSGNAAKYMPKLVTQREALLLVTPQASFADATSLTVTASAGGQVLGTYELRRPSELFRADNPYVGARQDVTYSRRAWSVVLPWNWVQPGLELVVRDNLGRVGTLAASAIEFGAPAELVVQNIRIGMLTDPPRSNGQYMLLEPAKAAADYFQTLPVARLTVTSYEDVRLSRVMVANGRIYESASEVDGGTYNGDMRENTAKSTFSVGINLANWGITSSSMLSQNQPQLTQTVVAHHAAGNYRNGAQSHGLSGGNGILTLYGSYGNEFSHEIGHHFGLGHHPGASLEPKNFWSVHHADSGWNYLAYRKRMRANLAWHWPYGRNDTQTGPFFDLYYYNKDAMSGGESGDLGHSALSRYTHYTGYSVATAIQPSLDRPMFDPTSPSGYKRWKADEQKTVQIAQPIPVSGSASLRSQVWFNGNSYRVPRRHGVSVFTVLGGYDPDNGSAVLYPPARGNWGNVFDLPSPVDAAQSKQCWLRVTFAAAPGKSIAVAPTRLQAGSVNKLHIQVAEDERPTAAVLHCQEPGQPVQTLATIAFPAELPPLPAPVVIGEEAGYEALATVELAELDADLRALESKTVAWPGRKTRLLLDTYSDRLGQLSPLAQAQAGRVAELRAKALQLSAWIDGNRHRLDANEPQAWLDLDELITTTLSLQLPGEQLPAGGLMLHPVACLKLEQLASGPRAYFAAKSTCTLQNDSWVLDVFGRVRPRSRMDLCLSDLGTAHAPLKPCSAESELQLWNLGRLLPRKREATNVEFDVGSTPAGLSSFQGAKASDVDIPREGNCISLYQGRLINGRGELWSERCTPETRPWVLPEFSSNLMLLVTRADHWPYIERWSRDN